MACDTVLPDNYLGPYLIMSLAFAIIVYFIVGKSRWANARLLASFVTFALVAFLVMKTNFYAWYIVLLPSLALALGVYFAFRKKYSFSKRLVASVGVFLGLTIFIVVYLYISPLYSSYSVNIFHIPEDLAYCQYGTIEAYATTPDVRLNADCFIITQLINSEGNSVRGFNITASAFPLKRDQQAKKIVSYNCTTGCKGSYTIILGTPTMRLTRPVTCD